MTYVFETMLGALRGLRYQNETMVTPKHGDGYIHLHHDAKSNTLNVLGTRNTLQCFEFPQAHNVNPRLAFELSCLDVAEQLGYKPTADVLRPVLMDLLLNADFPRFRYIPEKEFKIDAPESNCVQHLLTVANTYLKG